MSDSWSDPPIVARLSGGRVHLHHGPIDIVLRANAEGAATEEAAHQAAIDAFDTVLCELVAELSALRRPVWPETVFTGAVARRMVTAVRCFPEHFVTPMAAVAGSVADYLLKTMQTLPGLTRAYVNNGGDIALFVKKGEHLDLALADPGSKPDEARISATLVITDPMIGGIATSGWRGRSFSLGIAESVTVLARDAAIADVAATLICNAVDCDSPAIRRTSAHALDPDSDLGDLLVTVDVGQLSEAEVAVALSAGEVLANQWVREGRIIAAALRLKGALRTVGRSALLTPGVC